jgi:hypothetical protein
MVASSFERDPRRVPTTASLRALIDNILVGDSDLEAFCLDYFPRVKKRFSNGMERKIKVTILLEQEDRGEVLTCLRKDHHEAFARYAHLVEYALVREGPPTFSSLPASEGNASVLSKRRGALGKLDRFFEEYPSLVPYMVMAFLFLIGIIISALR